MKDTERIEVFVYKLADIEWEQGPFNLIKIKRFSQNVSWKTSLLVSVIKKKQYENPTSL